MTAGDRLGAWLVISALAVLISLATWMGRRRALRRYWGRVCTGKEWHRRFPNSSREDIREFLTIFVDAFCYSHKRRTCFSPTDRVMDIYRAEYPPGSLADSMELETLCLELEKRYGIRLDDAWHENITLGELYERTRGQPTT